MKLRFVAPTLILLSTGLAACGGLSSIVAGPGGPNPPLMPVDPNATATATAFIPLDPTETPIPTVTSTPGPTATITPVNPWGSFAGPTEPSAIEIPPPMPEIQSKDGVVNIALLGSDARPNEGGWRTDTILILSLDRNAGTASLLSIPRDLYVYIPGWRVERINTADVQGGFDLVRQVILYNFGIRIDHYARINFGGFISAVDSLGGIDVEVTGYLNDECGHRFWRYAPGVYHMDGFAAMCYVRMRKASSDFDRLRREQEVTLAIFSRVVTLNGLTRLPELYSQFSALVKTDVGVGDLLPFAPLAAGIAADHSKIREFSVGTSQVSAWRVPYSGAQVLLPNRDPILSLLQSMFGT